MIETTVMYMRANGGSAGSKGSKQSNRMVLEQTREWAQMVETMIKRKSPSVYPYSHGGGVWINRGEGIYYLRNSGTC